MKFVNLAMNERQRINKFRRPGYLSLEAQNAIEGGVDPALKNHLAHQTAAALLARTQANYDPQLRERIIKLVENEGIGDISALWADADPISLPGALWRLFLLHTWTDRDPGAVQDRIELGKTTAPGLAYLAGFPEPPNIDTVKETLNEILTGAFTKDLAIALRRAAAVSMLAAFGTVHLEQNETSEAENTLNATRLLKMGEDLEQAAIKAETGVLS